MTDLEGLTRAQVEEKLGKPPEATRTRVHKVWIYYYEKIEVYFNQDDVVEWVYDLDAKERVL